MKATKTKNTWAAAGSLVIKKVIGAGNIASYDLYYLLCLILNREAAKNLGRSNKAAHQHSSIHKIGTTSPLRVFGFTPKLFLLVLKKKKRCLKGLWGAEVFCFGSCTHTAFADVFRVFHKWLYLFYWYFILYHFAEVFFMTWMRLDF